MAGIEIENTFSADVYGNNAHDNSGGILVYDLPELQQSRGNGVRVHDNKIHDHNTPNFAPAGNIVGQVPSGTGSFVMANHDVEIFANAFANNGTSHLGVVSYFVIQIPIKDMKYYPYPAKVSIHDNTFAGGGTKPDLNGAARHPLEQGAGQIPGQLNWTVIPVWLGGPIPFPCEPPCGPGSCSPVPLCATFSLAQRQLREGPSRGARFHLPRRRARPRRLPVRIGRPGGVQGI